MNFKKITRKEAAAIVANCSEYSHYPAATLKSLYNATNINIEKANYIVVFGAFTYGQLEKEGINNGIIINDKTNFYKWGLNRRCTAWIFNGNKTDHIDSRWININTNWRKSDYEEMRKDNESVKLIISGNAIVKDWRACHQEKREKTPHELLKERLQAFKHSNDKNRLAKYNGVSVDIKAAKNYIEIIHKTIKDNINKLAGSDLIKYCLKVEDIKYNLDWLNEYIEKLVKFGNGETVVNHYYEVNTMSRYNVLLKDIGKQYAAIMEKIGG